MSKKRRRRGIMSNEEFRQGIYDLVGDEYSVLGKYKGSRKHVKIRHNKCGYEYEVTPTVFKSGRRCRKCSIRSQVKSNEVFVKEVNDLVGEEYIFLEDYKDSKTKLKIIHNICGRVYGVTPNAFLTGYRCSECYFRKISKTKEDFIKEVDSLVGEEYTVLGEYVGYTKHIKIRHNICGYGYEVVPTRFINGNRCRKCQGRSQRKTNEDFLEEVNELVGEEYTFLEEYQTAIKKLKVRHNECGNVYEVTANNFLGGTRCPVCTISRGEGKVERYLKKNNIPHRQEQAFDGLKRIRALRYDFSILDESERVIALIEFDGIQHTIPRDFFGGKEGFEQTQESDNLKNEYAKENNIPLIRIPYKEINNVERIVEDFLENNNYKN